MDYQNLFTQVQVVAEPHHGSHLNPRKDERERIGQPFLVHLFGRLGNAQIGPVYLGTIGVASLFFGMIGFRLLAGTCCLLSTGIRFSLFVNSFGYR